MRLLRRNLLATYGVYAASVASGLVVTPIAVHALGLEEYGVWAFVTAAAGYFGLLDLGVGSSIIRESAANRGRGDAEETNALASVGLVLYALIALVTIVLGAILAWFIPELVAVPDAAADAARLAAFLVLAAEAARFPRAGS